MRLIQHKREAFWFYRFLSMWYDRWVNPLFWTTAMRGVALEEARLAHRFEVCHSHSGSPAAHPLMPHEPPMGLGGEPRRSTRPGLTG